MSCLNTRLLTEILYFALWFTKLTLSRPGSRVNVISQSSISRENILFSAVEEIGCVKSESKYGKVCSARIVDGADKAHFSVSWCTYVLYRVLFNCYSWMLLVPKWLARPRERFLVHSSIKNLLSFCCIICFRQTTLLILNIAEICLHRTFSNFGK